MSGDRPDGPHAHPVLESALRTATVLVVDDEPMNVRLIERILAEVDLGEVHGLTDPRQVVAAVEALSPALLILDLHMPHLNGLEVLAALPRGAFLPVLVLTGDVSRSGRDQALAAGALDFVTKPFDRSEVVLRVRNLLTTGVLYRQMADHNEALANEVAALEEARRRQGHEQAERGERIDTALRPGGAEAVFQPIVDLASNETVGVEALSRFLLDPRRPPDKWFAEAWMVGRGVELELASIARAVAVLTQLPSTQFMALNVAPATAMGPELAAGLAGLDQARIVLELTEHERVDDYPGLTDALAAVRSGGTRIAVDDAGAGYATMRHILELRPDILKLDIALVRHIDQDPARRAMATALLWFASEIGAQVIAEGIETDGELKTLRNLGVPWGQGYRLARPARMAIGP